MIRRLLLAAVLLNAIGVPASWAVEPSERLADPGLEARARVISQKLRCLVCQNESIDESNAPLAHDLRLLVRRRLVAGDTDQQVLNYIVTRYGVFVLLNPPFEPVTWLLWLGPPALVLGAGAILLLRVSRRRFDPRLLDLSPIGPPALRLQIQPFPEPDCARLSPQCIETYLELIDKCGGRL